MRAVKRQPKIGVSNLMLKKLLLIGIGASSLLVADDAPIVQVQVSHTERMDFPSGGVLRMKKSTGDLTVEGWDCPDVEITTIKSTKSYHRKIAAAPKRAWTASAWSPNARVMNSPSPPSSRSMRCWRVCFSASVTLSSNTASRYRATPG